MNAVPGCLPMYFGLAGFASSKMFASVLGGHWLVELGEAVIPYFPPHRRPGGAGRGAAPRSVPLAPLEDESSRVLQSHPLGAREGTSWNIQLLPSGSLKDRSEL